MVEVSTSILSVKENDLKLFYNLEVAKTDYFHIDVMDNEFVPNDTIKRMQEFTSGIKQISNLPLDVHLMVKDIKAFIDSYIPYEPNTITFHIEACNNKEEVLNIINYIKENNSKVGIAIKPNTKPEEIYEYLPYVHTVLVMTVEPGLGGQKLIPETIDKVKTIKSYIDKNNLETNIEVDGGINLGNVQLLKDAGANIIVAGTSIINSKKYSKIIEEIKK